MKKENQIYGQVAAAPRMTRAAAFLVAVAVSVPVFVVLNVIDALRSAG